MIDVDILCNPYLGEPFKISGDQLIGLASEHKFQIKDGIPRIIDHSFLSSRNKLNQLIYNFFAPLYEHLLSIGDYLNYSHELSINKGFLQKLEIYPGMRILEIGIGPGYSAKYLPANADHIGIDLSWNMLQKAKQNMLAEEKAPLLIQALAEYIPIKNNSMDIVFQIGTLQFTEDPFKAVSEMARVAKPGSSIYVIDEIRGGMKIFKRSPAHGMHVQNSADLIKELPRLVPLSMINIRTQNLPGNQFYQLQFTKPKL